MADHQKETLATVLCEDRWQMDSERRSYITFRPDGTGDIVLRRDIPVFICAVIEWRAVTPSSLDSVNLLDLNKLDADGSASLPPSVVASEFEIEITMTKRRPASWGTKVEKMHINEEQLTEDAFAPKRYRVALEKGEFRSREDLARFGGDGAGSGSGAPKPMPGWADKFALRLVFDKSPYPPREEWKEPGGMPDANRPWEWREFCGRRYRRTDSGLVRPGE
ncbi:hypothetical protein SLS62_001527 [Diatrype stigma]|uniref:Uncharacterized protein n=1 Tax=Diatrype stigma TaxID=117547 RepID=A0AAN9UZC9_9PEZI